MQIDGRFTVQARYNSGVLLRTAETRVRQFLTERLKKTNIKLEELGYDDVPVRIDDRTLVCEAYFTSDLPKLEELLKETKPVEGPLTEFEHQRLRIRVLVPKKVTPNSLCLLLDDEEKNAVQWLNRNLGRPQAISRLDDPDMQYLEWIYTGNGIYFGGILILEDPLETIEFKTRKRKNWTVRTEEM